MVQVEKGQNSSAVKYMQDVHPVDQGFVCANCV